MSSVANELLEYDWLNKLVGHPVIPLDVLSDWSGRIWLHIGE